MTNTPFAIQMKQPLEAELINRSSEAQLVLHDAALQPSRLRLFLPSGKEVDPQDSRMRQKYDNSVSREMYEQLPAAGRVTLFDPILTKDGDAFGLEWGPYQFGALSPGTYSAEVEWQSKRRDYVTDSGHTETLPDVWLGTVRSDRFALKLPF